MCLKGTISRDALLTDPSLVVLSARQDRGEWMPLPTVIRPRYKQMPTGCVATSNRNLITRAQSCQWFDRGNVRAEIRESLGWCRRPRMNLRCVATRSSKYRGRTAKNQ
jgi:hypothetical protein